jgi:hypothetical protein
LAPIPGLSGAIESATRGLGDFLRHLPGGPLPIHTVDLQGGDDLSSAKDRVGLSLGDAVLRPHRDDDEIDLVGDGGDLSFRQRREHGRRGNGRRLRQGLRLRFERSLERLAVPVQQILEGVGAPGTDDRRLLLRLGQLVVQFLDLGREDFELAQGHRMIGPEFLRFHSKPVGLGILRGLRTQERGKENGDGVHVDLR